MRGRPVSAEFTPRELLNAVLRKNLAYFIQRVFASVDPGATYLDNWHIYAIARQLERIECGEINRLVITLPPRCLKSISCSVAFPAWYLGHHPSRQVVAVSYSEKLAEKFANDSRKVMQSAWYKSCFPKTRVSRLRNARNDFETSQGGGRLSTSVGGTMTGRGGDIIIIDDANKPGEVESKVSRENVIDWFRSTLLSRLNAPTTDPIVVIQQRVHEEDLAGYLLRTGGWEHLNLPAIAEDQMIVDLGIKGKLERREGHLLHDERLPLQFLTKQKEDLGSFVFAAQYQQRPAPKEGGIVQWDWFKIYDRPPEHLAGAQIVQSWDTASCADEMNDYSVCTTWSVYKKRAWLLDVKRKRLEFPELRRAISSHASQWSADLILIENAGSGLSLIQDLRRESQLNIVGIVPRGDKATRLMSVSPLIEGGRVSVPKDAPWLAELHSEMTMFPNGRFDDQVDSVSQFLGWLKRPPPFQWYVGGKMIEG